MKRFINKLKAATLIELISVIAIIGLLSSITASFIKRYQSSIQLYAEAQELRSNIENARAKTIAEQKTYGIRFLSSHKGYDVISVNAGEIVSSHNLDQEVSFSSIGNFTDDTISFAKSGAAQEAGAVILENSRQKQKTIIINPSGYVQTE